MGSSERFLGAFLSSVGLETAFGGEKRADRMKRIRVTLEDVRKRWPDNEQYRGLLAIVNNYVQPATQPPSIQGPLKQILEGYHDYADTNYQRPVQHEPERYICLQLYCTKDGYDYLFRLVSDTLRSRSPEKELILTAATLVEILTIDLYNLRLSNIGDEMFSNFQGVTYRGLSVSPRDVDLYRQIATAEKLSDRNFAIPLGLTSSTTDPDVMRDFAKDLKSTQCGLHMTIHIHGVNPDLLSMYLERYPDSVVSTICAMPVARLSPFGEKEILLRGAFFHIINMQHQMVNGRDIYSLVVVMINANRDHTTESSSDQGQKAEQRRAFTKAVKASQYEVCALLAEQYSKEDAQQYRLLQKAELTALQPLHINPKLNTRLADARSKIKRTWLGGCLFDIYPQVYAFHRRDFRQAILAARWSLAVQILKLEYEHRVNDWFNIVELKEDDYEDARPGHTILHILASTSEPVEVTKQDRDAWEFLKEAMASFNVWKTLRTLDSSRQTAQEIAILTNNSHLAEILQPRIRHQLSTKTLADLEMQLHQLIRDKAGALADPHKFHMPSLSILTEMDQPQLWIPIPHMYGGFHVELVGAALDVKVFETIAGKTRPQITNIRLNSP